MNYAKVFETLVNETEKYVRDNRLNTMVLGISGGLDSTVTAAICHEVEKRNKNIKFIGVSLPCSSNSGAENDSANICMKAFCKAGNYWVENIQKEYMLMKSTCELHSESTNISQGNLKARLRMIYLYNLASINKGLVMDTDNLTEHYLGFFTIHGDDSDFNPIGGLWKHEVYALANYLKEKVFTDSKALGNSIALIPTDGNGVAAGGDLAQIAPGKTYDDVDEILGAWVGLDSTIKKIVLRDDFEYGVFKKLCDKHSKDIVKKVVMRSVNSEFKRKQRPFIIDIHRGYICEKNGSILG